MFVYTITESLIPVGELPVAAVACPHCSQEQLSMHFFNLRQDSFFHAFITWQAIATTNCGDCGTQFERHAFTPPLKAFFKANEKSYRGKIRFWFKWKFVAGLIAFVLALVVGSFVSSLNSKANLKAFEERDVEISRSLAKPVVGDIYEVQIRKGDNPESRYRVTLTQTWLKLIRVEGDRLIMVKDQREIDWKQENFGAERDARADTFESKELVFKADNKTLVPPDARLGETTTVQRVISLK